MGNTNPVDLAGMSELDRQVEGQARSFAPHASKMRQNYSYVPFANRGGMYG